MATLVKARSGEKNTYNLPQGNALRRALKTWFRRQRSAVLDYLMTGQKDEHPPLPGDWPDWDDFRLGALAMSERMMPYIEAIWDEQGRRFTSKIGLDPDEWSVTNPHTQAAIDKATLNFCQATQATTDLELGEALEQTRSALTAGLIEHGESIHDFTRRIKEIFAGAETWRARRIAATEASRATHDAEEMAATESGVVTGWKWLLSEDACPLCQVVARKVPVVKLGQAFAVVGDHPDYSTIKHPPLHPSCQCTLEEILDIDEQPKWAQTLHDPEPEAEDYHPDEVPERLREKPAVEADLPPLPTPRKPKPVEPVVMEPEAESVRLPGPSGTPVGHALPVRAEEPIGDAAKDAISSIESVHGDGSLPRIPITSTTKGSASASFSYDADSGFPIGISARVDTSTPRTSIAHEIGHFLDWSGIPKADPKIPRNFRADPRFAEWIKAVDESEAVKSLRAIASKKEVQLPLPSGTMLDYPVDRKHVKYLLQDNEIFARSYAQYIAERSGNVAMKAEITKSLEGRYSQVYAHQWKDDEFQPISAAFDRLFEGLGWIK